MLFSALYETGALCRIDLQISKETRAHLDAPVWLTRLSCTYSPSICMTRRRNSGAKNFSPAYAFKASARTIERS